jgi:hypothetical protein
MTDPASVFVIPAAIPPTHQPRPTGDFARTSSVERRVRGLPAEPRTQDGLQPDLSQRAQRGRHLRETTEVSFLQAFASRGRRKVRTRSVCDLSLARPRTYRLAECQRQRNYQETTMIAGKTTSLIDGRSDARRPSQSGSPWPRSPGRSPELDGCDGRQRYAKRIRL